MAVKFSQFVVETDKANVNYLVGWDGTENVQITPADLLSGTPSGSGAAGQVAFFDSASTLTGTNNLFCIKVVVLGFLSSGYQNAPYENSKDVPVKFRHFTDKDGKPLPEFKPMPLVSTEQTTGENGEKGQIMKFRSFEPHPKEGLRTKCRGKLTDTIGILVPGTPLNILGYIDTCKISGLGVESIEKFSIAVLGIRMKSKVQCERGWGIAMSSIDVIEHVDASMFGVYAPNLFYNPFSSINEQTEKLINRSGTSKEMEKDMGFVRNFFRQEDKMDIVSEIPLVVFTPKDINGNADFFVDSNNCTIHCTISAKNNIYANKTLDVFVDKSSFSERTKKMGAVWISELYKWLVFAGAANVAVVHDDYRYRQTESVTGLSCLVLPRLSFFFANAGSGNLTLTKAHEESLSEILKQNVNFADLEEDNSSRYSGWIVSEDSQKGITFAVIVDCKEVKYAKKTPESETKDEKHSSPFVQIYPGMHPDRGIYLAYFVCLNASKVKSAMMVGLKALSKDQASDMADVSSVMKIPENVNLENIF